MKRWWKRILRTAAQWCTATVLGGFMLAGCSALDLMRFTPQDAILTPTPNQPAHADAPPTLAPGQDAGHPGALRLVMIDVYIEGNAQVRPELVEGSQANLVSLFTPSILTIQRKEDGSVLSTAWQPWPEHPVREMRTCFSLDVACMPQGEWEPFREQTVVSLPVDWLGDRSIYLAAEFRDAGAANIPSVSSDQVDPQPLPVAEVVLEVVARADPQRPTGSPQPPQVGTAMVETQQAFPVTGSVLIEDGRCCAGGDAGSQIEINVAPAEYPRDA